MAKVQAGAKYHGPTDAFGFPIGTQDDHYDICFVIDLEEYYDEYGVYGFRPSRELVEHPNGRGKVERRVLQASLIQELRSFNMIVNVYRSRAGNKNYFMVRAPTLSEWAKKVWVPMKQGMSDCNAHIPRARPRVFMEKCINIDRDKRLRDMGIPMMDKDPRQANPDVEIHEVQVLMSWYDYWADKYKMKYVSREHEKGFNNFYLPYEFNDKSFYENEGEHNLVYDGALVTLEDLEDEIAHSGAARDVAGKILQELRKTGKWWPPEQRYGANYILNKERIEEKAKWETEGKIYDTEAQLKLKSDLERFSEANEIRVAQGKAELSKPLELRNRKVFQTRYEAYREASKKIGWLSSDFNRVSLDEDKWLEKFVLDNAMRASSIRIELLMRVIEEACKRRITIKKSADLDALVEEKGDLIAADDKQAERDRKKDQDAASAAKQKRRAAGLRLFDEDDARDLLSTDASPGTDSLSSVDMRLNELVQLKVIEDYFALHHPEARLWFIQHWAQVPLRRLLFSSNFWLARSPVHEIRAYFGEEEAFYFAWLGLYTRMLYIPAFVGLLTQLWNVNNGSINDSIVVPFFCFFLALWAIFFIKSWKRMEADLAHRWGQGGSNVDLEQQLRPEFVGTPVVNPYTEVTEMKRTSGMIWEYLFKVVYLLAVGGYVVFAGYLLGYQHTIRTAFGFPEESPGAFFWFHLSIGGLSTVGILLLDEVYSHVAIWFTEKENHATDKAFDRCMHVRHHVCICMHAHMLRARSHTHTHTHDRHGA